MLLHTLIEDNVSVLHMAHVDDLDIFARSQAHAFHGLKDFFLKLIVAVVQWHFLAVVHFKLQRALPPRCIPSGFHAGRMHTSEGDILVIDIEPERWRLDFPAETDGYQGHGRRFTPHWQSMQQYGAGLLRGRPPAASGAMLLPSRWRASSDRCRPRARPDAQDAAHGRRPCRKSRRGR